MLETVLVPTDGSDAANRALDRALELTGDGGTVHVLHVADTAELSATRVGGEVVDELVSEGNRIVEACADRAGAAGHEIVTAVQQGSPAETIDRYASDHDIDLILMSTRGRHGVEEALLGSTAERVVRHASVPVLTVHPDVDIEFDELDRILVPLDEQAGPQAAIDIATDLARQQNATIELLHVVEEAGLAAEIFGDSHQAEREAEAGATLDEAVETIRSTGFDSVKSSVETGDSVAEVILNIADDRDVDLICMGTHGRGGIDRYVLGSVTERVVRTTKRPVLTVRHEAAAE